MVKNENTKDTKETKDNVTKDENKDNDNNKLTLFEEDDYFEEFDDEGNNIILIFYLIEFNENNLKENIDFKQWQENWEDEDVNDQFEKVLKRELDNFKNTTTVNK
jgi:hypothetical protein